MLCNDHDYNDKKYRLKFIEFTFTFTLIRTKIKNEIIKTEIKIHCFMVILSNSNTFRLLLYVMFEWITLLNYMEQQPERLSCKKEKIKRQTELNFD